jgi:hypothetical protein
MFEKVPTFDDVGLPDNCPVDVLKLAQEGRFRMLNPSELPSASDAEGRKLYVVPTVADVVGVPEITGGRFEVLLEVESWNAGNVALAAPSVTVILMFDQVPAVRGTPCSLPLYAENDAQLGLLAMLNRRSRGPSSGSTALGSQLNQELSLTVAGGVPEMVGT